ncbi:c-type cytochrome [Pseudomonas sp. UBA6323]|uniref:c-type cytochrome n=1 Tax=Pseudomonas sp. UBA6323 TaxID=1947329 RepID=UPI0025D5B85B|nr:cytochrome c [Pseudomonas sp. UBA6323]
MKTTLLLALITLAGALQAAEFEVQLEKGRHTWNTSELLQHPLARDIEITDDVSYKRAMQYRAVPISALLSGVTPGDHLQAVALDGFAAELPAAILLASEGAKAWLAIEDPQHPWPPLAKGKPSAGPFYLVWSDPAASQIGPEQWPFQVARLRQLAPVEQRFPALLPATDANAEIRAGFAVYQKNCMACHRLNGAGDSEFGPDLNMPHNPTEYFTGDFLRQYIRNPQSLRRWPQGRMPGFTQQVLSEQELTELITYLAHMADIRDQRSESQ